MPNKLATLEWSLWHHVALPSQEPGSPCLAYWPIPRKHWALVWMQYHLCHSSLLPVSSCQTTHKDKDTKSLGVRCSSVKWAAKSSVTWLGSPPGKAAQTGHTYKCTWQAPSSSPQLITTYLTTHANAKINNLCRKQADIPHTTSTEESGWSEVTWSCREASVKPILLQ